MPTLEGDEGEVKLETKKIISERVKLNPRKKEGAGLKILTLN